MNDETLKSNLHPFLSSRIRDVIALLFAIGFITICYVNMTVEVINEKIYNAFEKMTYLVLGYYFGNRGK